MAHFAPVVVLAKYAAFALQVFNGFGRPAASIVAASRASAVSSARPSARSARVSGSWDLEEYE